MTSTTYTIGIFCEGLLFLILFLWRTKVNYARGYLDGLRDVQMTMSGHVVLSKEKLDKYGAEESDSMRKHHNPHFSSKVNAIINVLRDEFTGKEDHS